MPLQQVTGNEIAAGSIAASDIDFGGTFTFSNDATFNGVTIGEGAGSVATNTAVGASALAANTTGANNVAVGYQALDANTTGVSNTAVGDSALGGNTTGANNSAVGRDALVHNTTGSANSAVGVNALYSNTTGIQNSAMGLQALYSNTTGIENSAMGRNALYSNTTGSYNSAVGYGALTSNTTGTDNTAVGYSALDANTTGIRNVAVGTNACGAVTTGIENTSTGFIALRDVTTGNYNTGFGSGAGFEITTGGTNTCIGISAGRYIQTGSFNLFVGPYAYPGSNATNVSNEVVIGTANGGTFNGKGANTGFINANGGANYAGNNSASWSTISDRRIKKNIVDNNEGLEVINQIRVRNFEYRLPEDVDPELGPLAAVNRSGVQLGIIAQELAEVCPGCVTQESTGVLSVDSDEIFWHMVNAIKQLKAEIDQLKGN